MPRLHQQGYFHAFGNGAPEEKLCFKTELTHQTFAFQSRTVTFYGSEEENIVMSKNEDRIEKSSDGYPNVRVIADLPSWSSLKPLNVFLAGDDYNQAEDQGSAAE